ncbi:acyltransferase [Raineyella sp.]|nr:acyltransferase [Raineyella sp.]MEA5155864.1 acyltransferase [Raineyella sp.]
MSHPPTDDRRTWMDLLRGIAMVLVVMFHAGLYTGGEYGTVLDALLRPFRMPVLMALSGLLLEHSLAKGARRYLRGKARGILWPWLVWMIVMVAILTPQAKADPGSFLTTGTNLWFLQALACCYGLALVLRPLPPAFTAVPLVLVAGPLQDTSTVLATYAWYGSFFFLGATLSPVLDRWLRAPARWAAAAAVLALVGALAQVPRGLYVPYRPENAAISLAGILAAIWLAARLPRVAPVRVLEWIGRNSMVTYLVHTALMVPVSGAILRRHLGDATSTLLSFTVVFAACLVMTALQPWTPWLYRLPLPARGRARRADRAEEVTGGPAGFGPGNVKPGRP